MHGRARLRGLVRATLVCGHARDPAGLRVVAALGGGGGEAVGRAGARRCTSACAGRGIRSATSTRSASSPRAAAGGACRAAVPARRRARRPPPSAAPPRARAAAAWPGIAAIASPLAGRRRGRWRAPRRRDRAAVRPAACAAPSRPATVRVVRAGGTPHGSLALPTSRIGRAADPPCVVASTDPMAFYVTTPIFYVNAAPHLGHAYSAIGADILARHKRQRGEEVFFLTGTDEHGEPVAQAAEEAGVTPKELADRNAQRFLDLMPILNVSNDFFIRTTDQRHKARVQEIMQRVHDNGHVYKGPYEGWYCPRCADFKAETEIGPDNTCLIHLIPLTRENEENWFFRLSRVPGAARAALHRQPDFVLPRVRYNEARSFITGGLQDVSLSRAQADLGREVPWDRPRLLRLVRRAAQLRHRARLRQEGEDLTDTFWPATFHVMAKDILKFHAVIWPALLLAAGLRAARARLHPRLPADERPEDVQVAGQRARPVPDHRPLRHGRAAVLLLPRGLLRLGRRGLAGGLRGALHVRARQRLRQPRQPHAEHAGPLRATQRCPTWSCDPALAADFETLADEVCELLDRAEVTQALERIWQRVRRLNRYVEETRPGSWPRTRRRPTSSRRPALAGRGAARGHRPAAPVPAGEHGQAARRARRRARRRCDDAATFGAGRAPAPIGALAPLFPKPQ